MDPLTLAALISGGASILGSFFGSNAADKASKAQVDASNRAIDLQAKTIAQARADAAPWLKAGQDALAQYQVELGLKPGESKYQQSPGYQFQEQEGERAVTSNLAALGMKNSGAALKALTRFGQNLANTDVGQYLARLSGVAGVGQNAMESTNAQSLGSAATQGQLMQDAGTARASGYTGGANAWIGGLNSFANNMGAALGNYNQNWQYAG